MFNLPSPLSEIPYHRLSYSHPSPIHLLPQLTQHVRNGARTDLPPLKLWAKREDQAGPLACYGNKYRKFEYIIPDILSSRNVTTIVTEGAVQSNHTVQVASMARVLGLKCTVLLHQGIGGFRKSEDKNTFARVGNVLLNRILGADVQFTEESDTGDQDGPLLPTLDTLRSRGEVPYWIPSGASLHKLGSIGYVRAAFEIAWQETQMLEAGELGGTGQFDHIFVACGSGSTLAGLIAGFALLKKTKDPGNSRTERRIIGVMTSPTKSKSYHEERILRLAKNAGSLIGLNQDGDITAEDVVLDDEFVGDGYGILDQITAQAVNFAAISDSLLLDPVYTSKVMLGMMNWASGKRKAPTCGMPSTSHITQNVLFVHTGGQSALSAYADIWPDNTYSMPRS